MDFDKIYTELIGRAERKTQIATIKAQAEIDTIHRERTAYEDGVFDAIKVIKEQMEVTK